MDSEKVWVEVQGEPGYVYCPDDIRTKEDGVRYVTPVFNQELARDKYKMSESEIEKQSHRVLLVRIPQEN